jgi:hypothetical protein
MPGDLAAHQALYLQHTLGRHGAYPAPALHCLRLQAQPPRQGRLPTQAGDGSLYRALIHRCSLPIHWLQPNLTTRPTILQLEFALDNYNVTL